MTGQEYKYICPLCCNTYRGDIDELIRCVKCDCFCVTVERDVPGSTSPKSKIIREAKKILDQKNDPVNHPSHYTAHPSGIECIEITRHENFNCGNAIKYIWRRNEKGNPIQDLKKAIFYIQDEIKRLEKEQSNESND